MRYTARTRYDRLEADAATRAAVAALERLLSGDSPYVFRHRLAAGEGLVNTTCCITARSLRMQWTRASRG